MAISQLKTLPAPGETSCSQLVLGAFQVMSARAKRKSIPAFGLHSSEGKTAGFLGGFQIFSELGFVFFGHAHEADAVAQIGMASNNFGPCPNFLVIQPEHYIDTRGRLKGLHHFDVAAAFADVSGLATAREIFQQVPRLSWDRDADARKSSLGWPRHELLCIVLPCLAGIVHLVSPCFGRGRIAEGTRKV